MWNRNIDKINEQTAVAKQEQGDDEVSKCKQFIEVHLLSLVIVKLLIYPFLVYLWKCECVR